VPRGILPCDARLLSARALSDWLVVRDLSLLVHSGRIDVRVSMSRDVVPTALTEVRVDVRVDMRVRGRHLYWCLGRYAYVVGDCRQFYIKKFFVLFCGFYLLFLVMGFCAFTRYPHQGQRMNCEDASAASAELQGWGGCADRGGAGAGQSAIASAVASVAASEAAQHSSDGMFEALRLQGEREERDER